MLVQPHRCLLVAVDFDADGTMDFATARNPQTGEAASLEVFINKSTDIDLEALDFMRIGNEIRVRGFLALFPLFGEETPEINPRSRRDIRPVRHGRHGRHK